MKSLKNFILNENFNLKNKGKIKQDKDNKYHYYEIYLPKYDLDIEYIDEADVIDDEIPAKGDEDRFLQLECHNKMFTAILSPKYIRVEDVINYKSTNLLAIIYEFGKEQNNRITDVDINYWSEKEQNWVMFATASKVRMEWRPDLIEDDMKEKYPFN